MYLCLFRNSSIFLLALYVWLPCVFFSENSSSILLFVRACLCNAKKISIPYSNVFIFQHMPRCTRNKKYFRTRTHTDLSHYFMPVFSPTFICIVTHNVVFMWICALCVFCNSLHLLFSFPAKKKCKREYFTKHCNATLRSGMRLATETAMNYELQNGLATTSLYYRGI